MSLTLIKTSRISSNKLFKQFSDEKGEVIECNQSFFRNRKDPNNRIIRLCYELWIHSHGKTCKVLTSVKGERGSRRIFKGKLMCRSVLDKFKALPYAV